LKRKKRKKHHSHEKRKASSGSEGSKSRIYTDRESQTTENPEPARTLREGTVGLLKWRKERGGGPEEQRVGNHQRVISQKKDRVKTGCNTEEPLQTEQKIRPEKNYRITGEEPTG